MRTVKWFDSISPLKGFRPNNSGSRLYNERARPSVWESKDGGGWGRHEHAAYTRTLALHTHTHAHTQREREREKHTYRESSLCVLKTAHARPVTVSCRRLRAVSFYPLPIFFPSSISSGCTVHTQLRQLAYRTLPELYRSINRLFLLFQPIKR